jgi:predicted ribosome quality control (RQC) complex YloA/Tae2 family protein
MYYDALTLSAMRDELAARLLGGRVQRVVQPSAHTIGLEVYAGERHQLWLSAEASTAGVWLATDKVRRGSGTSSPLQLLLAKYVDQARLIEISQPPLERVLRLVFEGALGRLVLLCEIMGRYSNIILLGEDGLILDAIKRVPATINRYRTILPKQSYVAPPAQAKAHPLTLTLATLRQSLETASGETLWQRLVGGVTAISPLLAREIAHRASGDAEALWPLADDGTLRLLLVMQELLRLPESHAWQPCLALDEETGRPIAYAPYALTHLPHREEMAQISTAIQRFQEARHSFDAYAQARQRLRHLIHEGEERQGKRVEALRRSLRPAQEIEALRTRANAILANTWAMRPGQTELVVDASAWGGAAEGETLRISLDPKLSPSENAQELFRTYRKLQAAAQEVPALIEEGELELAYLRQLRAEVELAENRLQLDEVEHELREAGYLAAEKKRQPSGKSELLSARAPDGTLILVGRNSQQNDEVTFRRSTPDDLWLHAHGVPGAHVIIKCAGQAVHQDTLMMAARFAARYSTARSEAQVQVDCTARRYVRHIKGARPGMVTYTHETTFTASPDGTGWEEE